MAQTTNLPEAPPSVNADLMTREQFLAELREGLEDAKAGRYQEVSKFKKEFFERRGL